ncbi:MAG: cation-efflux pump [Candidatus Omnitrophica bacterium]|jgi:cation diffusion facilitator family transporter|nr:cation-efflux pump [Candidatus Omnitrophota bacterium]
MDKYQSLSIKVSWLSIGVNLLISIAQFIIGINSKSISIMTDAADSLRDIVATAVVIFSLNLAKKPADKEHPFGHGRIEDVGGVIVALFLLLMGLTFLKESFMRFIHPQPLTVNFYIISIMAVASVIKFLLGFITQFVSRKAKSSILEADAFHHYTDCITTIIVAVGLIFVRFGFTFVDAALGFIIAFLIIWWSFKMLREFVDNLLGRCPPVELCEKIKNIALSFKSVAGAHDIEIHSYGKNKVISLHIELSPELSLLEAHSIADSIEKKVHNEGLGRCVVHVDLKGKAKAIEKEMIEKTLAKFMLNNKDVKDFHGIEIIISETTSIVDFHLCFSKNTSLDECHKISHKLSDFLKKQFGFTKVNIHAEPYRNIAESRG